MKGSGQEVTTWVGFDHQAPGQLQLPLDEDGNHIADAWDTPRGRHGADPRADVEDVGGLFTKGDGYGLYEEYRGFYLQPASARSTADRAEHVELDPDRRDERSA